MRESGETDDRFIERRQYLAVPAGNFLYAIALKQEIPVKTSSLALIVVLFAAAAPAQVPFERIVNSAAEPDNWLTYSGEYMSRWYSALDGIDTDNVSRLRPAWVYELPPGVNNTTGLVVDGRMYITELPSTVTALDAATGDRLWTFSPDMPDRVLGPTPFNNNRGVAILTDSVFVGTLDARLISLDAASGEVQWDVRVEDNSKGYSISSAPLAIDGKIITGVAGGDRGIRGLVDAYDADTGERLWRTWTIPAPGEPGSETWEAGSDWEHGGGATWTTGSYDPELDLIYWPTGNPGPDYAGEVRPGDNLFSNSLLALDPDTGAIEWYFQFTPHDTHDWDSNETPVLFDAEINGRPRQLVALANRNAFYYVLDRATGEFITGLPFARQTWAEELDVTGRPIVIPGSDASPEGSLVYPSMSGAANWHSPSYNPTTGFFYQNARDAGGIYTSDPEVEYQEGGVFFGGGHQNAGDPPVGAVRALEAATGRLVWEHVLESPEMAGLISTAGGLVFGGDGSENFYALDAATGELLWDFKLRGRVRANPMTYAVDGRQFVAIPGGNVLFAFALP